MYFTLFFFFFSHYMFLSLQDFLKYNESYLMKLPCKIFDPIPLGEGAGVGRTKDTDLMEMPEGSTLYDLVQTGITNTYASVGVVVRLREELALVKDIPVLFAIDQVSLVLKYLISNTSNGLKVNNFQSGQKVFWFEITYFDVLPSMPILPLIVHLLVLTKISLIVASCIQYNSWFTFTEFEEPMTVRSSRPIHAKEVATVSRFIFKFITEFFFLVYDASN